MDGCSSEGARRFAVVGYIPGPLGEFVDDLRRELVPQCRLRAHVTVLPPRSLVCPPDQAWEELKKGFQGTAPFRIQLEDVRLFVTSEVVYISIGAGAPELERLHNRLNQGGSECQEFWPYHPHVTLAQELSRGTAFAALDLAKKRWREFQGRRDFMVDRLSFVQSTEGDRWIDLADADLRPAVLAEL